jgi:hypothetical protein
MGSVTALGTQIASIVVGVAALFGVVLDAGVSRQIEQGAIALLGLMAVVAPLLPSVPSLWRDRQESKQTAARELS